MNAMGGYRFELTALPLKEGGGYVVKFPDIPGCLGVGDTVEEAIEDAQKALLASLDAFKAVDREPPGPSAERNPSS
jgi:predicted RNase H-like HicB family nuclease